MLEIIFLCGILAVTVFGIQIWLCLKANKKAIKRIPVYLIIMLYGVALIFCVIDLLNGNGGVAIWTIFAFLLFVADTVALAADIAAWIVYKQIQRKRE